jgi:hypothetical protein
MSLNGFEKLNCLLRGVAGRMEDLSANDEKFGYPNIWEDLMTEFSDLAEKLDNLDDYYDGLSKRYKKIFDRQVDKAIEEWPKRMEKEAMEVVSE